jgi:ferredoxin-NADP reductase
MRVFIQSTKARMRGVMRRAWAKTIWIGIGGGSKSGSTMKACCPISKQSSTYAVPIAFMAALQTDLEQLGVPTNQIHSESFGPA